MDASQTCEAAEILDKLMPLLLAVAASVSTWLLGLAKGKRTPRREEHAVRAELAALKAERVGSPPEILP